MPIEFACPSCSARMRCPDTSAGKKGKCPTCGTVVQIPGGQQQQSASAGGNISMQCPSCSNTLTVPQSMAGKKGKCPHCQSVLQVPGGQPAARPQASAPQASTGSVQFKCPQCGNVLKTPASAAGTRGKCPHCQGVIQIPSPSAPQQPAAPAANTGLGGPGDAFGDLGGDPLGAGGQDPLGLGSMPAGGQLGPAMPMTNPYTAPAGQAAPKRKASDAVKSKVMGPAISLIIVSAISMLVFIAANGVQFATGQLGVPPEGVDVDPKAYRIGAYVGAFVMPLLNGCVLAGAISLLRLKSYSAAMTASVLAVIPCCSPCYLLGIPFGIWALIVLSDANVKRAFG